MIRIDIATLFPDMCESYLSESIVGRGRKAGHIDIHCHNIRDYAGISTTVSMTRLTAAARVWSCRHSLYMTA